MAFFRPKMTFFLQTLANFTKKQYFYSPVRVSLAILTQIKKKNCFCSSFKFAVVLVRAAKKTRCRRMASVPPFWDICQWENFPGNLNTWPNTSLKRFFLLPFLQPKKKCPKIYAVTLVLPLKDVLNWKVNSYSTSFL